MEGTERLSEPLSKALIPNRIDLWATLYYIINSASSSVSFYYCVVVSGLQGATPKGHKAALISSV